VQVTFDLGPLASRVPDLDPIGVILSGSKGDVHHLWAAFLDERHIWRVRERRWVTGHLSVSTFDELLTVTTSDLARAVLSQAPVTPELWEAWG
jgi:hypothetical protein